MILYVIIGCYVGYDFYMVEASLRCFNARQSVTEGV